MTVFFLDSVLIEPVKSSYLSVYLFHFQRTLLNQKWIQTFCLTISKILQILNKLIFYFIYT